MWVFRSGGCIKEAVKKYVAKHGKPDVIHVSSVHWNTAGEAVRQRIRDGGFYPEK